MAVFKSILFTSKRHNVPADFVQVVLPSILGLIKTCSKQTVETIGTYLFPSVEHPANPHEHVDSQVHGEHIAYTHKASA